MPSADGYFDQIDEARIQRVKELSEIKIKFALNPARDPARIFSKAVVVLAYACWEGFYNDCAEIYIDFLNDKGAKVVDVGWLLLTGALTSSFQGLWDRNHSNDAQIEFVRNLQNRINCDFSTFDRSIILSRSNLDFKKLSRNLDILGINYDAFQPARIRIDKELVGWRHGIAHGDAPDLSAVDGEKHIEFTANLLSLVSDAFQNAIATRA